MRPDWIAFEAEFTKLSKRPGAAGLTVIFSGRDEPQVTVDDPRPGKLGARQLEPDEKQDVHRAFTKLAAAAGNALAVGGLAGWVNRLRETFPKKVRRIVGGDGEEMFWIPDVAAVSALYCAELYIEQLGGETPKLWIPDVAAVSEPEGLVEVPPPPTAPDEVKAEEPVLFDLNNPSKQPYVHQEFPQMLYDHGKQSYLKVENAEQRDRALSDGLKIEPWSSSSAGEIAAGLLPEAKKKPAGAERFPKRAQWLREKLKSHKPPWNKYDVESANGPKHKTVQRVLDELPVREPSLDRLAHVIGCDRRDIPDD